MMAGELESLIGSRKPTKKLPPLHWLRGWGKRIESWLDDREWSAGEMDWAIIRACRQANDAMLEFSVDFRYPIEEIQRRQEIAESLWRTALADPNEDTLAAYAHAQEVLAARIAKVCDVIEHAAAAEQRVASDQLERQNGAGQPDNKPDNQKKTRRFTDPPADVRKAALFLRRNQDEPDGKLAILRQFAKTEEEATRLANELKPSRYGAYLLSGTRFVRDN